MTDKQRIDRWNLQNLQRLPREDEKAYLSALGFLKESEDTGENLVANQNEVKRTEPLFDAAAKRVEVDAQNAKKVSPVIAPKAK